MGRSLPLTALLVTDVLCTAMALLNHHSDVLPFVVTGPRFMVASYSSLRVAVIGRLVASTALLGLSGLKDRCAQTLGQGVSGEVGPGLGEVPVGVLRSQGVEVVVP